MGLSPFPEIDRTDVSDERLTAFKSERDFVGLGVDLMIEAGSYVCIAANILGPDKKWTRDQAVIGGNVVRLYKLFSAVLDQTVQYRRETSFILARLAFETIVTIQFLLQEYSPELIDEYVKDSFGQEKKLLKEIDRNIAARSGIIQPIEDRMHKSIDRMFKSSGLTPDDIPERRPKDWGGKNFYEKAKAVGLEQAYLAMFAGASQNVHGAWGDLYAHHLEVAEGGGFTPNTDWNAPRPQLLFSIAFLSLSIPLEFAEFMGGEDLADYLTGPVEDLERRIQPADQAHENYLAGKTWPAI